MSQTIKAVYEDGVIKPLNRVDLPERTRLQVEITPLLEHTITLRDLWKGAGDLAEENLEAAKCLWEDGVAEQLETLRESSG